MDLVFRDSHETLMFPHRVCIQVHPWHPDVLLWILCSVTFMTPLCFLMDLVFRDSHEILVDFVFKDSHETLMFPHRVCIQVHPWHPDVLLWILCSVTFMTPLCFLMDLVFRDSHETLVDFVFRDIHDTLRFSDVFFIQGHP